MLFFPQLSTGAMVQLPFERNRQYRRVTTQSTGGNLSTWVDTKAAARGWTLQFRGLSNDEADALTRLFLQCQGKLHPFCFVDPTANLLAWSEELQQSVWSADPMLGIQAGISDPRGTLRASKIINGGAAIQSLTQAVSAPAGYVYSLSAYVRSDRNSAISLGQRTPSRSRNAEFATGPEWRRIETGGSLAGDEDGWTFCFTIPAQGEVEVFGLQVEAQPGASAYKRSGSAGGAYPAASFADDQLTIETAGLGVHDCSVRIFCAEPS